MLWGIGGENGTGRRVGAVWMEQKLEDADRTSGCTSDTDNKNRRSQKFTNLGERREGDTLHWMGNTIGKKKTTAKKWAERLKKKKKHGTK